MSTKYSLPDHVLVFKQQKGRMAQP